MLVGVWGVPIPLWERDCWFPSQYQGEDAAVGVGVGGDAGSGVGECRCGAEVAGPAGAGDRVQELLHGVPERAGAAARPRRVPALGDLPAGPVPDALPTHRGGLPGLLLPPPAPGQHVWMGLWHPPALWGSLVFIHPPGWLPVQGSGADVPLTPMASRVPVPCSVQPALTG